MDNSREWFFKTLFLTIFWLFFVCSVVLFKKMLNKIRKKDSWILTGIYVLFFFGLVFSRYSADSLLNGENFISKAIYSVSMLLLIGSLIYYYAKYHQSDDVRRVMPQRKFVFISGGIADKARGAAFSGRRERWLNIVNDQIVQKITGRVL